MKLTGEETPGHVHISLDAIFFLTNRHDAEAAREQQRPVPIVREDGVHNCWPGG